MEPYKTIYRGDLKIGDKELPVKMWSETTKREKPIVGLGITHNYAIKIEINCATKNTKDTYIREIRDMIKNKISD